MIIFLNSYNINKDSLRYEYLLKTCNMIKELYFIYSFYREIINENYEENNNKNNNNNNYFVYFNENNYNRYKEIYRKVLFKLNKMIVEKW